MPKDYLINHSVEKIKLSSGARLINIIVPNLPLSYVSVWFRAGARYDPDGQEGMAHLFEHLYMTRTKRYPDKIQRFRDLESRGIYFNAKTNYESVFYYQIQLTKELYNSLKILIEALNNSSFRKQDLEREKEIIINEKNRSEVDPKNYIYQLSREGLWPNGTLAKNIFGDAHSLKSININDLIEYQKKFYLAKNLFFVIISNEKTASLKRFIEKNYQPKSGEINFIKEKHNSPEKIIIKKRDTNQLTVAVNYRTTSIHENDDNIILDFISDYLANKWISRLVEELRLQRDITYWVNGESVNFSDTGCFGIIFSCKKEKTNFALKIISNEIEKVKKLNISKKVLDNYKRSYLSSLTRQFIDPFELIWWYGYQGVLRNKIITLDEHLKRINKLQQVDLRKVAKKYFTKDNLSTAIIGNIQNKDVKVNSL